MRVHAERRSAARRRALSIVALTLIVLIVLGASGTASGQTAGLKVGDPAPPFALRGSDGRVHSLSDHLGIRPIVLAWFPRVLATL